VIFLSGARVGILVVANGCSDTTTSYLAQYVGAGETLAHTHGESRPARLPIRWIEDPSPGKSHALNLSVPMAIAPVIAFVDDDHRVDSGYLRAVLKAALEHPECDLFCGRILPDWDGTEPAWAHDDGEYRIYPLPVPRFDLGPDPMTVEPGTATPGGGNLAIRRGLFGKVGPFLLELGPRGHDLGGAEDIEWVRRAITGGARLHYAPAMLQYHYVDPQRMTLRYVVAKAYERSASTIRVSNEFAGHRFVPPYMLRKAISYALQLLVAANQSKRRFYLTRLAAALGEIKGFRQSKQRRVGNSAKERKGHEPAE